MAEGGVPGVEDVARLGRWLARNGITSGDGPPMAVSYTHLTLPTIYSV